MANKEDTTQNYCVSKGELTRRKWAYVNLAVNSTIGMVLASFVLRLGYIFTLVFALAFFVGGVLTFRFFNNFLRTQIILTGQRLRRVTKGVKQNYQLADINKISVKLTTQGVIREVGVWLQSGKAIFFNGLDNFGGFKADLVGRAGSDATVVVTHEPLNFDHPAFYTLLGLLLGSLAGYSIYLLSSLDYMVTRLVAIVVAAYVLAVGTYITYKRPIASRYGGKTPLADYVLGLILVCAAIVIVLLTILR
jgi:hypothetical protein